MSGLDWSLSECDEFTFSTFENDSPQKSSLYKESQREEQSLIREEEDPEENYEHSQNLQIEFSPEKQARSTVEELFPNVPAFQRHAGQSRHDVPQQQKTMAESRRVPQSTIARKRPNPETTPRNFGDHSVRMSRQENPQPPLIRLKSNPGAGTLANDPYRRPQPIRSEMLEKIVPRTSSQSHPQLYLNGQPPMRRRQEYQPTSFRTQSLPGSNLISQPAGPIHNRMASQIPDHQQEAVIFYDGVQRNQDGDSYLLMLPECENLIYDEKFIFTLVQDLKDQGRKSGWMIYKPPKQLPELPSGCFVFCVNSATCTMADIMSTEILRPWQAYCTTPVTPIVTTIPLRYYGRGLFQLLAEMDRNQQISVTEITIAYPGIRKTVYFMKKGKRIYGNIIFIYHLLEEGQDLVLFYQRTFLVSELSLIDDGTQRRVPTVKRSKVDQFTSNL